MRLCTACGWTLSRLMADAETRPPKLVPAASQPRWTDPESRRDALPQPGKRDAHYVVAIVRP